MSPEPAPVFEALMVPHRSLTRAGVVAVFGVLLVSSALIAWRFGAVGAWPVAAFSLIDIPLVAILLALNLRQTRATELIMLSAEAVTVIRTDAAGRRCQFSLPAAWLRCSAATRRW